MKPTEYTKGVKRCLFCLASFLVVSSCSAQEENDCEAADITGYNLGLHIGAVFILLGVSLLGSFLPIFMSYWSKYKPVVVVVKLGTFFGFGTILATAFIHMLAAAQEYLSSPCLSEGWHEYEPWSFMFAVVAIVFMQLLDYVIELVVSRYSSEAPPPVGSGTAGTQEAATGTPSGAPSSKVDVEGQGADTASELTSTMHTHFSGTHMMVKPDVSQSLGFYFVEAGIVFHSVLIGLTLGVTTEAFTTLLIALSFHQFFEGLAVGAAAVETGLSKIACFFVAVIYSLTTPIGIAVGIAVRSGWNENSQKTLLVQGILDALSAGILIYVVLVELVTPMMTKSGWLRKQHPVLQIFSFASFWAGTAVMAVIGTWA